MTSQSSPIDYAIGRYSFGRPNYRVGDEHTTYRPRKRRLLDLEPQLPNGQ
ncbi:hypothetical protein LCGC14_0144260 [marine sediment metagenome]|uniref:Uncharacterized protein n=1 Tax=marine sediment metagenome TaxID=412755 RepID=A0A0F9XHV9_9ZZZZ